MSVKTFSIKNGTTETQVQFRPQTFENNKALIGFVNISIIKEGTFSSAFNAIQVIKTEKATFLKEPEQKAYKDKEGNWKATPYMILPKGLKDMVIAELIKNI